MESNINYGVTLKIIFIGDPAVGKSSLMQRITNDEIKENIPSTLGVDFVFKRMVVDDVTVKIQIWDTAGQERYRSLINSYYKHSDGIIMVFDVTETMTFDNLIENWINTLISHLSGTVPKILLLANKSDLKIERSVISPAQDIKVKLEQCPHAKFRDMDTNPIINYKDSIKEEDWNYSGGKPFIC